MYLLYYIDVFTEIDLNGMETNAGEDSDSIGNTRNTKPGFTLPAKEKRKPFFKKARHDFY